MIKAGDTVRLKKGVFVGKIPEGRQDNQSAVVRSLMTEEGWEGGLMMEQDLRGCLFWNESDVERVS